MIGVFLNMLLRYCFVICVLFNVYRVDAICETLPIEAKHALIIGSLYNVSIEVKEAYLLLEIEPGSLLAIQADKMFMGHTGGIDKTLSDKSGSDRFNRYYFAAAFSRNVLLQNQSYLRYTFLLVPADSDGMTILPIKLTSVADLDAALNVDSLLSDNSKLQSMIHDKMVLLETVKQKTDLIIAKIADSPTGREAEDLKDQLKIMSSMQNELKSRFLSLQKMIEGSEEAKDADVDAQESELSDQLEAVAQLTAKADRMNRLKKLSYANEMKRKMSIIEEFEAVNVDDLQKELTQVFNRKAKLEEELRFLEASVAEDSNTYH